MQKTKTLRRQGQKQIKIITRIAGKQISFFNFFKSGDNLFFFMDIGNINHFGLDQLTINYPT